MKVTITNQKPMHLHSCPECKYIGHCKWFNREIDFYCCDGMILGRDGNGEKNFVLSQCTETDGSNFLFNAASRKAIALGLSKQGQKPKIIRHTIEPPPIGLVRHIAKKLGL